MKLEKAIENRTAYLKNGKIPKSSDDYNATLLSIEALKRCKVLAENSTLWATRPLPGETKE